MKKHGKPKIRNNGLTYRWAHGIKKRLLAEAERLGREGDRVHARGSWLRAEAMRIWEEAERVVRRVGTTPWTGLKKKRRRSVKV